MGSPSGQADRYIADIKEIFDRSIEQKRSFASDQSALRCVADAARLLKERVISGSGKVLVLGNGGSAADSQHMAAELTVRFQRQRKALPCIALTTDTSVLTAAGNDLGFDRVFERQVEALAGPEDVLVILSTSGNSANVVRAARKAKQKGCPVVFLGGRDGGKMTQQADITIIVPAEVTARIQEVHITIIHILCQLMENDLSE